MSKNNKKAISAILAFTILCSIFLLTGCGEENRGYNDSLISPDWYSEKMNMSSADDYNAEYEIKTGKNTSYSSGYPLVTSVEDMVKRSTVIIRGRVLGFDYLTIRNPNFNSTEVNTDYYVEVLDVLRGEPYNDELITIRTDGGEDDERIYISDMVKLTKNKEYLFMLWEPSKIPNGYNTDGDYYGIVEYNGGYFEARDDTTRNADGITVPKKFRPCMYTPLNNEDIVYLKFVEKMKEYNELYPIDENYYMKASLEALKNNLASGFMLQEEYDRAMSKYGVYGEILYYTQPGDVIVNP